MNCCRSLLAAATLLVSATAAAQTINWPTSGQWMPLTQGGNILTDPAGDVATYLVNASAA